MKGVRRKYDLHANVGCSQGDITDMNPGTRIGLILLVGSSLLAIACGGAPSPRNSPPVSLDFALAAISVPNAEYQTTDLKITATFTGWQSTDSGTLSFSDNRQAFTSYAIASGTSGVYSITIPNIYPGAHTISAQYQSSAGGPGIIRTLTLSSPISGAIPVPQPHNAYIGAFARDKNNGIGVPTSVADLESKVARPIVFSVEYPDFTNNINELWTNPTGYTGDTGWPEAIAADFSAGRIPLISWTCTTGASGFYIQSIASGQADLYLDAIADGLIALSGKGNRVMLRWCWEMNLSGRTGDYQATSEAGRAAEYVAAFQHIVTRIRSDFADSVHNPSHYPLNVAFSFNPSGVTDGSTAHPVGDIYYPGDEFVDWIALDKYNDDSVATLDQVNTFVVATANGSNPAYPGPYPGFFPTYTNSILGMALPLYPSQGYDKPLMIGETGAPYCDSTLSPPCTESQWQYLNSLAAEISGTASGALGSYDFGMIRAFDYWSSTGSTGKSWELDGGLPGNGGYQAFKNLACSSPFLVQPTDGQSLYTCK